MLLHANLYNNYSMHVISMCTYHIKKHTKTYYMLLIQSFMDSMRIRSITEPDGGNKQTDNLCIIVRCNVTTVTLWLLTRNFCSVFNYNTSLLNKCCLSVYVSWHAYHHKRLFIIINASVDSTTHMSTCL